MRRETGGWKWPAIQFAYMTFLAYLGALITNQVLRSGLAKLFRHEPDTRELIKMKEIYELLETVTDRCEDVANIIEGIVLENA